MENGTTHIIDLAAEVAKLTMFRGRTPTTTFAERKGTALQLGSYRDGILLLSKSAGTGHWETHPEDELLYVLDGALTVDIVVQDKVQSLSVGTGMIAVVPPAAWHRVRSADGVTVMSATIPGDHIDLDIPDPRSTGLAPTSANGPSDVVDINGVLAKLTMFRRTPTATEAERKGSVARLASYRDGALFAIKSAGIDHWESHLTGDELVFILDGAATLDVVGEDGPRSFNLRSGLLAVIPKGAWHRIKSLDGVTQMSVTPFPGEHIEHDVDDPRTVAGKSS
jgi:mannose-6-phosphate isomerase-like protein (cupin superfamily)